MPYRGEAVYRQFTKKEPEKIRLVSDSSLNLNEKMVDALGLEPRTR